MEILFEIKEDISLEMNFDNKEEVSPEINFDVQENVQSKLNFDIGDDVSFALDNDKNIAADNTTKTINTVELKSYSGTLTDVLRTVAEGGFSCRENTAVFADFTANIRGLGASDVRLNALYDGVKQTVYTVDRAEENGSLTVHFSVSVNASAGTHTISAEACGNAEIERITGVVWGQGIVGEQAVPTNANDYEFTVVDKRTTITKYIGSSKKPSVPSTLGGADVKIIGDEAFSGLEVEFVYIPEGVEKIL